MKPHVLAAAGALIAFSAAHSQSEPVAVRPTYTRPPIDTTPAQVRDSTGTPDSTTTPRRQAGPGCWRAQPSPRCEAFIVTDIGAEFPVYTTRREVPIQNATGRDFGSRLVWSVGFMRNIGGDAMGPVASVVAEFDQPSPAWMLEWRYRRWQSATSAVDVGLGYKTNPVWQVGAGELRGRGMTAMFGWTPNRWIGLNGRVDLIRARGEMYRAVLIGVESTRTSEFLIRGFAVELWRALLAKIGVEWETDD